MLMYKSWFGCRSKLLKQAVTVTSDVTQTSSAGFPDLTEELEFFDVSEHFINGVYS